jgi:hypothetical protein
MHPGSDPFQPTPEDALIIVKWKLRMALLYGAVLLVVLVFALGRPVQDEREAHDSFSKPVVSSAAVPADRSAR